MYNWCISDLTPHIKSMAINCPIHSGSGSRDTYSRLAPYSATFHFESKFSEGSKCSFRSMLDSWSESDWLLGIWRATWEISDSVTGSDGRFNQDIQVKVQRLTAKWRRNFQLLTSGAGGILNTHRRIQVARFFPHWYGQGVIGCCDLRYPMTVLGFKAIYRDKCSYKRVAEL